VKQVEEKQIVELYSDGGAEPNPGKGGYGVILSYKGRRKEFLQGYRLTTNNRMELLGVIVGLEQLKRPSEVNVYTDSMYVVEGIEKGWAKNWKSNNWYRNRKGDRALNIDLWERLLNLLEIHQVKVNWVKGHNGHIENERCDFLAEKALKRNDLLIDVAYENKDIIDPNEVALPNPLIKEKKKKKKAAIMQVGDRCRKCNTPIIKKIPKRKKMKEGQDYYYDYYLFCPNCKAMYMVDEAKRFITSDGRLFKRKIKIKNECEKTEENVNKNQNHDKQVSID